MRTILPKLLAMLLPVCIITGCSSDDPEVPETSETGSQVSPDTPVPDPEGTISLSMRDYNNGYTNLDYIYIKDENFKGEYFASVGAVNGLGNISQIPISGWSKSVAVTPGNGYVAHSDYYDKWYRIFVTDYIVSTTGGIIGADIKYQAPFKGVDETLLPETTSVAFNHDGGSQAVMLKNSSIVPFTVTSSDYWCIVERCSSHDQYFLYDGVMITVLETAEFEQTEAIVTLRTLYGKETEIKVTRAGAEPYINYNYESDSEKEIDAYSQKIIIGMTSNMSYENWAVQCDADWCSAEITNDPYSPRQTTKEIKYVENRPLLYQPKNTASHYMYLTVDVSENSMEDSRSTEVKIYHKDESNKVYGTLNITQKGATLVTSKEIIYFDKNSNYTTITVSGIGNYTPISSDDSWLTFSKNGAQLTIRATATTTDRVGKISFEGFSPVITVDQSKYAVGDNYDENGITGFVVYIDVDGRYIYNECGEAQWSKEFVRTGATDRSNGQTNMDIIRGIPNWQELYPAFAAVEKLNTNGVTGWYLPAIDELRSKLGKTGWSSTEDLTHTACYYDGGWTEYSRNKDLSSPVWAVRKF